MVFSWKKNKKEAIIRMRMRIKIYLKHGRNQEAKDLQHRIDKKERENA